MEGLNDNHKRRLRTTFQAIDTQLTDVLHLLEPPQSPSPFAEHVPDATPVQHRVISDYVRRFRELMTQVMSEHQIDLPPQRISAIWAARTSLALVRVAVEELQPQYMRGYGQVPTETAERLRSELVQLDQTLGRMEHYLAAGSRQEVGQRLGQIQSQSDHVQLLRELERIITAHGLVEFRPTLEAIVDRLESPSLEIAMFGRVSCGKSSLLNHILGTNALPVGVTPVTSIPTRVVYGPQPRAVIWLAEAKPITVEVDQLADFVTEQQNPGNAKHVSRVRVELPSALLRDGITFVDTPGVGSLASAGAAESIAYLPRCDLGIVLIDASSSLGHDDVVLAELLRRSGAEIMVLISKADMLTDDDRQRMLDYAQEHLDRELHERITPYPVSVKPQSVGLFDTWFNTALRPSFEKHTLLAEQSMARKIHDLRDQVIAALRRRASATPQVPEDQVKEVESILIEAISQIDSSSHDKPTVLESLDAMAARALHEVAHDLVVADGQASGPGGRSIHSIDQAYVRCCQQMASAVSTELIQQRDRLAQSLSRASSLLGGDGAMSQELPTISGMPISPESAGIAASASARPLLGLFSRAWEIHLMNRELHRQSGRSFVDALQTYADRLESWRSDVLKEMRRRVAEQADLVSAFRASRTQGPNIESIQRDVETLDHLPLAVLRPENVASR